jgi:methylglutaconyl-CoA hydratase
VVGPAVERKIGTAAFSALAIDATCWRSAQWANENGLFAELHTDSSNLDAAVMRLTSVLSQSSQQAMAEMKKYFGKELHIGMSCW